MKVLVWKSHGCMDIYDVNTPELFASRINDILEIVSEDHWDMQRKVELVKAHMQKHPDDVRELRRAFNTLVNEINPAWDNSDFEELYVTDLK